MPAGSLPYNPRMEKSYESRLGFLITDTGRLCGRLYDKRAKRLGLTRAQSRVLAYLTWEGEMNQARLAEFLEITPMSLTRLLDRMQAYGWVERSARLCDSIDAQGARYLSTRARGGRRSSGGGIARAIGLGARYVDRLIATSAEELRRRYRRRQRIATRWPAP
jgi:hypothetical protein